MVGLVGLGLEGIGTGLEIYGGIEQAQYAKNIAAQEAAQFGVEEQEDTVRQNAMHLSAQREMVQQVRNSQLARSQALAAGTNQGSQFGSGLQGAYAQISGQTGSNISAISQNLQFGDQMFNLNRQLSSIRMSEAQEKGKQASAAGISSIGGGLFNLGKGIG